MASPSRGPIKYTASAGTIMCALYVLMYGTPSIVAVKPTRARQMLMHSSRDGGVGEGVQRANTSVPTYPSTVKTMISLLAGCGTTTRANSANSSRKTVAPISTR